MEPFLQYFFLKLNWHNDVIKSVHFDQIKKEEYANARKEREYRTI